MFFPVSEHERRQAKSPHELSMINLLLFNLLIGIALLAGSMAQPDSLIGRYKWIAVAVPLAMSLLVIGFTRVRASRRGSAWFVAAHWKLAASRYKSLLIVYPVCAAILSLALFSGKDAASIEARIKHLSPAMQEMERRKLESQDMGEAVWARIAVVPLLLTVMVTIMLESGAIYQAQRGEVPDGLVKRLPPPPGLEGSDQEIPTGAN